MLKHVKKKIVPTFLSTTLILSSLVILQKETAAEEAKAPTNDETNVIMLIMDGSSDNVSTIARWY